MKIILSPAKTMTAANDDFLSRGVLLFPEETQYLLDHLRKYSKEELKKIFKCSEKIAEQNYERFQRMDLNKDLSPAVFSYTGLAYKHMVPSALTDEGLAYLQEHLRIISAFYGLLRPFDGVTPYRLEMQAVLPGIGDMYSFWSDRIYRALDDDLIINLASAEYSSAVTKYLSEKDRMINIVFAEKKNGKLIQKGTYAKMLRGEMVYWMAENGITDTHGLKEFSDGAVYSEEDSDEENYVFIRTERKQR